MAKATRILGVGLMALGVWAGAPRAASAQPPSVTLRIQNNAQVPEEVLARAQREVTRIYGNAGINAIWTARADIVLMLITRSMAEKVSRIPDAVGFAPTTDIDGLRGHVAYVLAFRIDDLSREHNVEKGLALGVAIAHEVGHLLLPVNAHSKTGIMRADWNHTDMLRATVGALQFTTEQATLMRIRLSAPKAN